MAHLISTFGHLNSIESQCVLKVPCKEVITSKFKNKLKEWDHDEKKYLGREASILINMCNKLSEKEIIKMQIQNEQELNKQFSKLKKKMRSSLKDRENTVAKYFDGKYKDESRLSQLLKNYPITIDIQKKYEMRIRRKMGCLKEVKEIESEKANYNEWRNRHHNSPLKSPNYTRMNFVLEKVEKNEMTDVIKPLRGSSHRRSENSLPFCKSGLANYRGKYRYTCQPRNHRDE